MEEIVTFRSFPHIGEKVFGYLTNKEDFKNCLFVCKSWNKILNTPSFWLNMLKRVQDVYLEDWQNLIIKLKDNDLAQKELIIGLREECFVGPKRVNGKFWCQICEIGFSTSVNLFKHQRTRIHFLKAGLISMSDYNDGYTYWTKILFKEKLSDCELCGSSYGFYKDHLRSLYHFYRGYELFT